MRMYADGDDQLYNTSWGYYILASAHIDHNECASGTWSGESEEAEEILENDAPGNYTWYADWAFHDNALSGTYDEHHANHNAYASYVHVP